MLFLRWGLGWRLYELGQLFGTSVSEARELCLQVHLLEADVHKWARPWGQHDVQPRVEGEV